MLGYELMMVLHPRLEEEEVEAFLEKVGRWINEKGGSLAKVEKWGRRKLAYPIKRVGEGNYVLAQFQTTPQQVVGIEANLKLSEEVLRHLIVRAELEPETEPEMEPEMAEAAEAKDGESE